MRKIIYLDHAATTPINKSVLEDMNYYQEHYYGNPSSLHHMGETAKQGIEKARKQVSKMINAEHNEVYFVNGGTEADNQAIRGIVSANKQKGNHIITSKVEHKAVLNTCKQLEKEGYEVTYLNVDEYGMISLEELKRAIKQNTVLITIMFANNEVGTIQPIEKIGRLAKENGVFFHTDAVQAIGNIYIDVKKLNIDALSMSAHKFYGPKGIGALYVNKDISFDSLIFGGGQEHGKRAGTENVPAIIGMGKAIEIARTEMKQYMNKQTMIKNVFMEKILNNIEGVTLNGHPEKRLTGNLNFSFEGIEGKCLMKALENNGICVSGGSACSAKNVEPSHVLKSIGLSDSLAKSAIRITLGKQNDVREAYWVSEVIKNEIYRLRKK